MQSFKMIYGTAWKKEKTAELVEMAINCGFRAIDTACQPKHYQEELVGKGIKLALEKSQLNRQDLFIQTKFTPLPGQDPERIPYDPNAVITDQLQQSFDRSLENLQTDYLDSWLLHSPISPFDDLVSAWRKMEDIHQQGGVRDLGISNCYQPELLQALCQIAKIKPSFIQNRFYQETMYDREIRAICQQLGMKYQSFWTLTANPHILADQRFLQLCQQYKKTPAQLFYKFVEQLDIIPLNGTTKQKHMLEDLEAFATSIADEDMETINSLIN